MNPSWIKATSWDSDMIRRLPPVSNRESIRLCSKVPKNKWKTKKLDFHVLAFPQAPVDRECFLEAATRNHGWLMSLWRWDLQVERTSTDNAKEVESGICS
jgi:hypothetical protein